MAPTQHMTTSTDTSTATRTTATHVTCSSAVTAASQPVNVHNSLLVLMFHSWSLPCRLPNNTRFLRPRGCIRAVTVN